jgi:hypothetical protein
VEAEEEAGPSFVYFARRDTDDAIKIGFSRDVRRRMRSIRALLKVRVVALAYMPGTMMDEREFHRRFAVHRLDGEWFSPAPEILALVAAVQREYGDQPAWKGGRLMTSLEVAAMEKRRVRRMVKALNARRREVDRMSPEEKRAYMETARNVVNFPAPCGPDEIAARAIARKKRG